MCLYTYTYVIYIYTHTYTYTYSYMYTLCIRTSTRNPPPRTLYTKYTCTHHALSQKQPLPSTHTHQRIHTRMHQKFIHELKFDKSGYTGLFFVYIQLFCGYAGCCCEYTGLYCGNYGSFANITTSTTSPALTRAAPARSAARTISRPYVLHASCMASLSELSAP